MPVFVEWKWQERTKSFLVIFHFYDDFSKPNLRIRRFAKGNRLMFSEPLKAIFTKEAWMTWAPSHVEMALLTELLSYANMINGLKEKEKRELKKSLESRKSLYEADWMKGILDYHVSPNDTFKEIGIDKKMVIYHDESKKVYSGVEICPEYIDYLKKLLRQ